MKSRTRFTVAVGLLACIAACQGVEGDPGEFKVRVVPDSTVTAMTLTDIDIPVANALPDPAKAYRVEELKGYVYWTVTPGAVRYYLHVSKKPEKGEKGYPGVLPYAEVLELPPLIASKGEKGEDKSYIFYVSGSYFFTLYGRSVISGTPF